MKIQSTEAAQRHHSLKNSKVLSDSAYSHVALASTCYVPFAPRTTVREKQPRRLSCSAQGPPPLGSSSSHVGHVHSKRRVKRHNISPEHAGEVRVKLGLGFGD